MIVGPGSGPDCAGAAGPAGWAAKPGPVRAGRGRFAGAGRTRRDRRAPGHGGWQTTLPRPRGPWRAPVRGPLVGCGRGSPDASYAGLYETFLDVPPDELADAVRRCFAAAGGERVLAYHQRHGGAPPMAVLVQRMVDPVAAGVAFTAHPVTGDRDQTVVTAVPGWASSGVRRGGRRGMDHRMSGATPGPAARGRDPVLTAPSPRGRRRWPGCRRPVRPSPGRRMGHRP